MNELRYQLDLMKAMNQKLIEKERMYRLLCETSEAAYLYYTFSKKETSTLGRWKEIFGLEIEDLKDFSQLLEMIDDAYVAALCEVIYLEKSGKEFATVECMQKNKKVWLQFCCHIVYENGNPVDKLIVINNITKKKAQNEELLYLAYYDGTTGLYNRNYFISQLNEFVRNAEADNALVSVILMDIDDFKKINDGLGMVSGDELVQQVGSFLKEFSSDNVIVGHISTDIFCIAIYDPTAECNAQNIISDIQNRMKRPFVLVDGQMLNITASMGVAEYPEAAVNALGLINCAEIVMLKGKKGTKNSVQFFDAPILSEFLDAVEMENKLKEAVIENRFLLYFQP